MPRTKPEKSKEVDAYIAGAPEFARPILTRIRNAFHAGCPELEEGLKWGAPHFTYHGLLGGMAAFKGHVGFGFWRSKEMKDPQKIFSRAPKASSMHVKVEKLADLPKKDVLVAYVKQAAALNDTGAKTRASKVVVEMPPELKTLLGKHPKARATFDGLAPSKQRDYTEWIAEAKREATREKRLAQTLELLEAGKERHWKYRR